MTWADTLRPRHVPEVLLAIRPALRYLDAHDRHRPLRAVADRQHPYRQRPHRAVQLAVCAEERRPLRAQRFDDTDIARSRQEYADQIQYDLHWLGIRPDVTVHQSARFDTYAAAVERLKAAGVLYACYETPEELELRRKVLPVAAPAAGLRARGAEARRGREGCLRGRRPQAALALPAAQFRRRSVRAAAHRGPLERPGARRPETVDLASLSDPVLVREDGTYLYTLPSVVDDIELKISHVIRGDDHVTNTGVQIALFRALGAEPPVFGHHNLLTTSSGEGLSKRSGALSIASLREAGIEPMAVASLAVLIGTSENVSAVSSMDELAARFELAGTSKSASKFDPAELTALNRALIHHMPFEEARSRLAALGVPDDKAERVLARGSRQSGHGRGRRRLVADCFARARKRRRNCPTRTAPSCATPMISCRSNRGITAPGKPGPTASRKRPAARARRSSCRSGWRLPDLFPGRSLQIYCPFWVGKEHWPDDPDLAFAGRCDRRRGRLRLGFLRLRVEPALSIGLGFRLVGRIGAHDRLSRSPARSVRPAAPSRRR